MMTSISASRPPSLNLMFVRHGETQDNIDRILQGWSDTRLTEKGDKEAQVMANRIPVKDIDAVYHSPLTRIVQTIQPILRDHPDTPTFADPDLRGQGLGKLEGGSYDLVDMSNERSADGRPGVELFDDFVHRLLRAMARIIAKEAPQVDKQPRDRNIVIATHGVGITSIFKALEGSPSCEGFVPKVAIRGPEAFEVRWTDSDDVSKMVVSEPLKLPLASGTIDWSKISGQPFFIEYWGKKEKALT